jgi:tetratricopeptide (TPR) repeat protein
MKKTLSVSKSLQEQGEYFNGPWRVMSLLGVTICLVIIMSGCAQDEAVYKPAVSKLIEKAQEFKSANQLEQAVCRLEAAADIAPETFQVHYNLGLLYYNTNQLENAVTHLQKALELSPEDANALYTLGFAYASIGDAIFAQLNTQKEETGTLPEGSEPVIEQGMEAYRNAVSTYRKFLYVAPSTDVGRKDVEQELEVIQSKVQ